MESYEKILNATRYVAGTLLTIGIAIFIYGAVMSGYGNIMGVGIGTVMGAVFIFLMGMFLGVSEEMIINSRKGKKESI